MSARIAPASQASVATATGHRSRSMRDSRVPSRAAPLDDLEQSERERPPSGSPPPAPPVAPPGTAFAVALLAGAQPPEPADPRQPDRRRGYNWRPPDSELQLADRKV